MNHPPKISRDPIRPDRVRRLAGETFGYLPHRFLRGGFFVSLTRTELALYVFLILVADRDGISFYGYDAICSAIEATLDEYIQARDGLIELDLIAFDGRRFQVLSLPEHPIARRARPLEPRTDLEQHDPATIRRSILDSLT